MQDFTLKGLKEDFVIILIKLHLIMKESVSIA